MINATLMREITADKRDAKYHQLSDYIQYRIKSAANDGNYSCQILVDDNEYQEETIRTVLKHLRMNNFTIMVLNHCDASDRDKMEIDVSWE